MAIRNTKGTGGVRLPSHLAAEVMRGRYQLVCEVASRLMLVDDLTTPGTQRAIKRAADREKMEHEASVLSMIGPDTAPELIEAFTHEGSHCLALQAAEIHGGCADLSSFCVRAQRMSEAERGLGLISVDLE